MHDPILAGLIAGFVTLSRNHQNSCLLIEPIPSAGADLIQSAPGQQQQLYQLDEAPLQWRGGERVQCGYEPLQLFV